MSRFGNTQYGEAGYSTIQYGSSGLYSGEYLGQPHTPAGPFTSSVELTMSILLDDTRVENTDDEPEYEAAWTHDTGLTGPSNGTLSYTSHSSGEVEIAYIGQEITIHYTTASNGGNANYEVVTDEPTPSVVTSGTINMYSASTEHGNTLTLTMPSLDAYKLTISRSSDTIYFDCLDVVCTDIVAYTRASDDLESWTDWAIINNTSVAPGTYEGETPDYNGQLYIQVMLRLFSSVSVHSPEVMSYNLFTGDVGAFYPYGTWQSNNLELGPGFGSLSHVDWDGSTADNTYIYVQTQSHDGVDWENWSNPYVLDQHIARLAEGFNSGTITSPYIIPLEIEHSTFTWNNTNIYGYLPGTDGVLGSFTHTEPGDLRLRWYIQNADGNTVTDAHYVGDTIDMQTMSALHDNQIRIRTELQRTEGHNSPMVVAHTSQADVHYNQTIELNQNTHPNARVSSVFNEQTGESEIIDIPAIGFTIPSMVTSESYTINDLTGRGIVDINWSDQSTTTTDDQEMLWARSTGTIHYVYQTGIVYHGSPLAIDLPNATAFTPNIPSSPNDFAYRVTRGWGIDDTQGTPVILHDNESIILEWESGGEDYETAALTTDSTPVMYYPITEMAITNSGHTSNDKVIVASLTEPYSIDTPWSSQAYIYEGTVNANYQPYREDYSVTVNLPPIHPPVIVTGDPYEVNFRNMGVRENGVPISQSDIEARFLTDDATPLPSLQLSPNVSTVTITNEPIVRGTGDMDLIPKSMVQSIIKISNTSGGSANYTQDVDYQLLNNHIDWSIGTTRPNEGNTYYVDYTRHSITTGHVTASSIFTDIITVRSYWQSNVVLKNWYDGQENAQPVSCTPDTDYYSTALPEIDDTSVWTDLVNLVEGSARYKQFNNNQLVSTYIAGRWSDDATPVQEHILYGTLGGRRPSRHWNPRIHDGYYYLNKEERFLYVDPVTFKVPDDGVLDQLNSIEIPYTPLKTSPIIITYMTADATPIMKELRQVAFSREDDNTYTTYVTEYVTLTGSRDIRLAYHNIDPNFSITISDEDGVNMFSINEDPSDNIITLAEYDGGSPPELQPMALGKAHELQGKRVSVTYQPKDCFVVDYNTPSGSAVKFTFSEDYDNLEIYYESTDIHPAYLALEADVNPIRTSLTSGFLYIAKEQEDTTYINIQMYPDQLIANGISRAIVSVDMIGRYGNPVIDSVPTVTTTHGTLTPYADDQESPSLRQMLGRYVYTYTVPASITPETQLAKIIVEDDEGIQREHVFTLVRED